MLHYFVQSLLPLGIFIGVSLVLSAGIYDYTVTDIIIGTLLCLFSNVAASFILGYKKKSSSDRVERINKDIHNGVWRKTMINL